MSKPPFDPRHFNDLANSTNMTPFAQAGLRAIVDWLEAPPPLNAAEQLIPLSSHLAALRASQETPEQHAFILERLYMRGMSVVAALLPSLSSATLPIPRKTRQLIRNLQNLLQSLAEDLFATFHTKEKSPATSSAQAQCLALWRTLNALAQHLIISNLTAAPPVLGIWQQLHQAYEAARELDIVDTAPSGATHSLQSIYYSAILLGCAQPASFTSGEVSFVVSYLERFSDRVSPSSKDLPRTPGSFWIDPTRDTPAMACSRKPTPPETRAHYFACDQLGALLKSHLKAIEAGTLPAAINLPDFAASPAGRGVIRRLITYWGEPGKRRFPRRRQNYRAALCAGLDSLWRLFQDGDDAAIKSSTWMITNESPDGYALMHVSGEIGAISVGDVSAIRTETGEDWQICIVRWVQSENQEHLEMGLQILATRAVPAFIALPNDDQEAERLSVLILPEVPALRSSEMIVVPTGALKNHQENIILMVEKDNFEVREIRHTRTDEQNSRIEVFSIEPSDDFKPKAA